MKLNRKSIFFAVLGYVATSAGAAQAHAAEQGLVLLLPTAAYSTAGTLTVVASILLVTFLSRHMLSRLFQPLNLGLARLGSHEGAPLVVSFMATLFLFAVVFVGLFGPTDPQGNLLPLTIWAVWWICVFVVQGTIFDVWKWVNPWTGFARVFGLGEKPMIPLPNALATWPAVVVLICFQLFLLADVAPSDPQRLAKIVLGYWALTAIGIELFGKEAWLTRVECFSVMFRLIGSLRPIQWGQGLGFPGWAGLRLVPLDTSVAVFCLVLLTGGSFDGLNETFWWLGKIGINPLEFPGRSAVVWSSTGGLLGAIALLLSLFGGAIWIGVKVVNLRGRQDPIGFLEAFQKFAVTLLPIALGYHVAHYLVAFMVQTKLFLSTASDPMALGWNLFGLGAVKVTYGFMSVPATVKAIWLTQATVVVFSHVVAVLMAHHVANTVCRTNKDAVLIQIGLTTLMIAYTVFGLWLLASPRGA